jgi:hypothetical protein|tara:strand:+ start:427 stop:861 length:435 start_codon:yes stop_codon:yes gene_type:complete
MLAEIAAANAAFNIIKSALSNGKELYDVSAQATQYFDNKSVIVKKAQKGGGKEELQCFMELEKIKEQEEWLKEYMIYAGRADMYKDWLQFQAECKRARDKEERMRKHKRAKNITLFWTILLWGTGGLVVLPLTMYIAFIFFGVI